MTLRTRFIIFLSLLFLAVCLNILAASYYSRYQIARVADAFETSFADTVVVDAARVALDEQRMWVMKAIDQGQVGDELVRNIREQGVELRAYLDRLARRTPELTTRLLASHAAYSALIDGFLRHLESGDLSGLAPGFRATYREQYQALVGDFLSIHATQRRSAVDTQSAAVQVGRVLVAMAVAELLILLGTLWLFSRWILKPIAAIRVATEEIARGNLDYRLDVRQEDELGALSAEINRMAGSLAEAQRQLKQKERMAAMGEMVSVVAHNIRNPLAGIRATAQTTMHEFDENSTAHQQQQRIIKSVDSLEQWLKELLHLNRPIELQLECTSVDELFADLAQIFQPATQRKKVEIAYSPNRPRQSIEVDRQHFVQAVASILDNAIEASPAGSVIRIETGLTRDPAEQFFIQIADAGAGVPETLSKQIFEPHFSTKPGGTGIGLSMAKKIIEAHSGRISVHAASDGSDPGAIFRITIPHRDNGRVE